MKRWKTSEEIVMAKKKMNFEEALVELETIVKQLESGDVPLEEALAKFQEGMQLSKHCSDILEQAEKTVKEMIVVDEA